MQSIQKQACVLWYRLGVWHWPVCVHNRTFWETVKKQLICILNYVRNVRSSGIIKKCDLPHLQLIFFSNILFWLLTFFKYVNTPIFSSSYIKIINISIYTFIYRSLTIISIWNTFRAHGKSQRNKWQCRITTRSLKSCHQGTIYYNNYIQIILHTISANYFPHNCLV